MNTSTINKNITWHRALVDRHARNKLNGHKSVNIWFTGLSGSGKSTLAHALEKKLFDMGCRTFVFDGDNVRHGLCGDLGFSNDDRKENIRRITEMVKLFLDGGIIALAAFIAPFQEDRDKIKKRLGPENYIEIYCNCSIDICEQRDVKGIYQKAREGKIKDFTGISSPYEPPASPDLVLDTANQKIAVCVAQLMDLLTHRNIFI
ncbi:MAG: adenylyl-sulfate kinase [Candidatus Magnetomorum sp.]|nr:adenylyl-sulfate kinase [Candidatus Magnetomorum sp.]